MPNGLEDELDVPASFISPWRTWATVQGSAWQQISARATGNNWTGFISAVCSHYGSGRRTRQLGSLRMPLCMAADHTGTPTPCPPYICHCRRLRTCSLQCNPMSGIQAQTRHIGTLETEAGRSPVPGQPGLEGSAHKIEREEAWLRGRVLLRIYQQGSGGVVRVEPLTIIPQ